MYFFFFFNDTATTEIYTSIDTLSLHDALPISGLHYGSPSLRPADLLALLSELTRPLGPANEDFYFRASNGLVTRSAAGYHYRGNWASYPGGTFTHWTIN